MILDHYAVVDLSGNHYHSVRKLIGKFIIDSEEKFQ